MWHPHHHHQPPVSWPAPGVTCHRLKRMTRVVIIINWLSSHRLCPKWWKAQLLSGFQSFPENSSKLYRFLLLWMHSCSLKVYISMGWAKGGIKVSGTLATELTHLSQARFSTNNDLSQFFEVYHVNWQTLKILFTRFFFVIIFWKI